MGSSLRKFKFGKGKKQPALKSVDFTSPYDPGPILDIGEHPSRRQCAYIYGDPSAEDHRYCGRPVLRDVVTRWCDYHFKRCVLNHNEVLRAQSGKITMSEVETIAQKDKSDE